MFKKSIAAGVLAAGISGGVASYYAPEVTRNVFLFMFRRESDELVCTTTTADAAQSTVQTAINAAASGDVVCVPADTKTWSSAVSISGKELTLAGAGIGQTVISGSGSSGRFLNVTARSTSFVRITGFTFTMSTANSGGAFEIEGGSPCNNGCQEVAFRLDHVRLVNSSATGGRGALVSGIWGLVDHNEFVQSNASGSNQMLTIEGSSSGSDGGYGPWNFSTQLGSENAVVVEDNLFSCVQNTEDTMDYYTGARVVVRYNDFYGSVSPGCTFGWHGTDSGNNRGAHSVEIYNNTWGHNGRAINVRSGTFLVFNNTNSVGTAGIEMHNYRSCPRDGSDTSGWDSCDGTNYAIGSASVSANESRQTHTTTGAASSTNVLFCSTKKDTLCTSDTTCTNISGGTCTWFFDGPGTSGYACRDQVGRGHDQVLYPVYIHSNTGFSGGGVDDGPGTCSPSGLVTTSIIVANRDWFTSTGASCTAGGSCTSGVGSGTTLPTTCTLDTGFWKTDEGGNWDTTHGGSNDGKLYRCVSTDTWSSYYTPSTYPHSLSSS